MTLLSHLSFPSGEVWGVWLWSEAQGRFSAFPLSEGASRPNRTHRLYRRLYSRKIKKDEGERNEKGEMERISNHRKEQE